MGRILALDYGTKRVGIAVTDPSEIIATPLETIHSKDILEFLKIYNEKENIKSFVVGLPKKLNNTDTHATKPVRMFVRQLGKKFPGKKIHLCDERFTSKIAQQAMLEGGMKKKDRQNKANVDKISATIILQSYLESRKHRA
ncbi:MAG: Holliday junction resolvase RuvX [Cytophagales bacterium]|nr:Holliday junction resolvase RuvX [Cytophagales bacterium]